MELSNILDLFISAILTLVLNDFIVKKVFDETIIKNKWKVLGIMMISSFAITLTNYYDKDMYKTILTLPFLILNIKVSFNIKYDKALIYSVVSLVYLFLGEILTGILFSILSYNYDYIFNNVLGKLIGTIAVFIFAIPFIYIKVLSSFFYKISIKYSKVSIFIFIVIAIGSFGYINAKAITNIVQFIVNLVILFLFFLMLLFYFQENIKSKEISNKYNELLSTLEKFEKELIEKRKLIHDFKNQLIVINGYVDNPEKLKAYLSEIIKDQRNIPNSKLLLNVEKLPSGLKGLIYYKFSNLDSNINVSIDVKNSLKKYESISPKLNKDCLKILGVFIDNAIEAEKNEKEKYINLELN